MTIFLIVGAFGGVLFLICLIGVMIGCQFDDTDIKWVSKREK